MVPEARKSCNLLLPISKHTTKFGFVVLIAVNGFAVNVRSILLPENRYLNCDNYYQYCYFFV